MTAIEIRHELRPGDLGRIVALHGECYAPLPGYGLRFEAYVARTLAEYVLDAGFEGRVWLAESDGRLVGCTALVLRDGNRGQLRWVLVDSAARGAGLGRRLCERALGYAGEAGCTSVFLETTDGLAESQALYESMGFTVTWETREEGWDGVRPFIVMQVELA